MSCPFETLAIEIAAALDDVQDRREREDLFHKWHDTIKEQYGPKCWARISVLRCICYSTKSALEDNGSGVGLDGGKMKVIRDAMLSCFPKSSDLEMFLKYELNKQLSAIATESTMPKMIFDVIVYADRYGWLSELVRAMRTKFEGNDKVAAAADIGL